MVAIKPLEKKDNWKKYKYYLLAGILILFLIGIFQNQLRQIGTFIYGITIDRTIDLIERDNSFNILIMGKAGGSHDGPDLTDTIIFSRVDLEHKRVDLISLPRDLWIESEDRKINGVYAIGKLDQNNGIGAIRKVIEEVTNQKVDYVLVLDFTGFETFIDALGGIEVEVETPFVDEEFPIAGNEDDTCDKPDEELELLSTASSQLEAFPCRYKTISFERGLQVMNGETALEFVRSRHGTNSEGSDFARSKRQQKVIAGVRNKVFSLGVILNPIKVNELYNIVKNNLDMDIPIDKFDDFVKLAQKMQDGKINSFVIDYGNESDERYGLVVNPPITEEYRYQWVLIPRIGNGNYAEIHEYINCIISGNDCLVGESGFVVATPNPEKQ